MQYSNLESILIKNSQTGFYISTPEGLLKDCNDSFVKMFGYDSKEDVLQHNTSVFYFDKNERKRFLDELHFKNHTQGFAIKAKTKSKKQLKQREFGFAKGKIKLSKDFDEPLDIFKEYI